MAAHTRVCRSLLSFAVALWLAAALVPVARAAGEPPWLREMPAPITVLERTKGSDPYDVAARRYATFQSFIQIMRDLQGPRQFNGRITAGESRRMAEYGTVSQRIADQVIASLPPHERSGSDSKRAKWFARASRYQFDGKFRKQLMTTWFSPQFQEAHRYAAAAAQGSAARGRAMMAGRSERQIEDEGAWAELVALTPPEWRWALQRQSWMAIFGAIFALFFARTLLTFRLASGERPVLHVGGSRHTIHRVAGVATNVQRWDEHHSRQYEETYVRPDGTTERRTGYTLSVTHHLQVMLREASGLEHDIHLVNESISVAPGQGLAAIWAIRGRAKRGPYVAFHNDALRHTSYMTALADVVRPSRLPVVPLALALMSASVSWTTLGGAIVAFGVVVSVVRRVRAGVFRSRFTPRLLEGMNVPRDVIVMPGGGTITPA